MLGGNNEAHWESDYYAFANLIQAQHPMSHSIPPHLSPMLPMMRIDDVETPLRPRSPLILKICSRTSIRPRPTFVIHSVHTSFRNRSTERGPSSVALSTLRRCCCALCGYPPANFLFLILVSPRRLASRSKFPFVFVVRYHRFFHSFL